MAPTPVPGGNSFTVRNSNQTATLPNGTYTTGDGVGDLLVANDIRFILTNRVGSGRRTLDVTIRDVNPNNIQVGRAYPLESADDSSPGVSNSNTGRALFDSGSGTSASGNGGSVIVDSFSFNPITNSGRATFRIVNGVFVPAGGSTESFNLTASATVTQN